MVDKIVYLRVTESGGEDGRNHNDNGGHIQNASFDSNRIKNIDTRYRIEKRIVDNQNIRDAIAKLDRLELYLIVCEVIANHEKLEDAEGMTAEEILRHLVRFVV